jgi:3-hydroxyacyl-[acyl-carrier-protein] dehydratase
MPGVLIIEALAQVSVILVYQTLKRMPDDKSLIFFAGIDNARFKRPVVPGDQLTLESTEIRLVRGVGKFAVRASVGNALVAEAELLAALRDL